jgi:hypothetical protein
MSKPSVPPGIDLDMLAEDLAGCISKYGYAEAGFDVIGEAIRPALPAFIAACLSNQAELDAS